MSEQKEERTKLRSMETNREQVRNQDKHDGEQQTQTKEKTFIYLEDRGVETGREQNTGEDDQNNQTGRK